MNDFVYWMQCSGLHLCPTITDWSFKEGAGIKQLASIIVNLYLKFPLLNEWGLWKIQCKDGYDNEALPGMGFGCDKMCGRCGDD